MATVATRLKNNNVPRTAKIDLTPTGLLMEGHFIDPQLGNRDAIDRTIFSRRQSNLGKPCSPKNRSLENANDLISAVLQG